MATSSGATYVAMDEPEESVPLTADITENPTSTETGIQPGVAHNDPGLASLHPAEPPPMADEVMATARGRLSVCEPELVQACQDSKYSLLCTVTNGTKFALRLRSAHTDEKWLQPPPRQIPPQFEVSFACNSNTMLCGVEAQAIYEVCVEDPYPNALLVLKLSVPVIGRNSAKVNGPAYLQWLVDKGKGDKAISTIELSAVHETAFQELREREVQSPEFQQRIAQEQQAAEQAAAAASATTNIPVVMGVAIGTPYAQRPQGQVPASPPSTLSPTEVEESVASIKGLIEIMAEVRQAGADDETLNAIETDLRLRLRQLRGMLDRAAAGNQEQLLAAILDAHDQGTAALERELTDPKQPQAPTAAAPPQSVDLADVNVQEAAMDEPPPPPAEGM